MQWMTLLGKGTVVSFGTNVLNKSGELDAEGICLLEMPEKLGSSYMVLSAKEIEQDLDLATKELPKRLKREYQFRISAYSGRCNWRCW